MMMNRYEKFEEALSTNDIRNIRSFLNNCILWDGLYIEEIKKYVSELSDKDINGEAIFQVDNELDLSKFKSNQEDLDKLSTESRFNFSKEKYLYRLEIAHKLAIKREEEMKIKEEPQNKIEVANKTTNKEMIEDDGKKKIAMALGLLFGVGAIVGWIIMKK